MLWRILEAEKELAARGKNLKGRKPITENTSEALSQNQSLG